MFPIRFCYIAIRFVINFIKCDYDIIIYDNNIIRCAY